jgi:hypothetical protein
MIREENHAAESKDPYTFSRTRLPQGVLTLVWFL